jgi:hypothetical protein
MEQKMFLPLLSEQNVVYVYDHNPFARFGNVLVIDSPVSLKAFITGSKKSTAKCRIVLSRVDSIVHILASMDSGSTMTLRERLMAHKTVAISDPQLMRDVAS